jgi:hypothetical protein
MMWRSIVGLRRTVLTAYVVASSSVVAAQPIAIAADAGLTPDRAVASGLCATLATGVLANLASESALPQQWESAKAELGAAARELAEAGSQPLANPLDQTLVQRHEQAMQRHAAAGAALESLRAATVAVAFQDMPAQMQAFEHIRAAAQPGVPPEFWVLHRSPEQWEALKRALTQERRAVRSGEPIPFNAATLLSQARSDLAVIAAQQRLATDLPAVRMLFQRQ